MNKYLFILNCFSVQLFCALNRNELCLKRLIKMCFSASVMAINVSVAMYQFVNFLNLEKGLMDSEFYHFEKKSRMETA